MGDVGSPCGLCVWQGSALFLFGQCGGNSVCMVDIGGDDVFFVVVVVAGCGRVVGNVD